MKRSHGNEMSKPSIFITGAAQGIGRAIALRFASEGWFVGLSDIDEEGTASLADVIGEKQALALRLDVTDRDSILECLERFHRAAGERLDMLCNNAGVLYTGSFQDVSLDRLDRMIAVNFAAVVHVTHAAFPFLRDTPGARVVNLSSTSAIYGVPEMAVYSATKHAVRAVTEALAIEWAKHGIQVSDVMPPFVRTAMVTDADPVGVMSSMGALLEPEEVANAVWDAANRRQVHVPVGRQFRVLNALQDVTPSSVTGLVMKKLSGH